MIGRAWLINRWTGFELQRSTMRILVVPNLDDMNHIGITQEAADQVQVAARPFELSRGFEQVLFEFVACPSVAASDNTPEHHALAAHQADRGTTTIVKTLRASTTTANPAHNHGFGLRATYLPFSW